MICLEIIATIALHKMLEFNQSKMIFIDRLQEVDGYQGFTEKAGDKFMMKINWESKKELDIFLKSENYRVFRGALITLSESHNTRFINESKVPLNE